MSELSELRHDQLAEVGSCIGMQEDSIGGCKSAYRYCPNPDEHSRALPWNLSYTQDIFPVSVC